MQEITGASAERVTCQGRTIANAEGVASRGGTMHNDKHISVYHLAGSTSMSQTLTAQLLSILAECRKKIRRGQ